nr:hypothetical protein [Tanacetum cinerariifolium]
MHIKFLENKPNVTGKGSEWLFDIDSLTISMNYEQVTVGNQTNHDAGIEIYDNAGQVGQGQASDHEYILLPFMPSLTTQISDGKDADEIPGKGDEGMYPFTNNIQHQLWKDVRLQDDYEVEMADDLLRLIKRQINEGYIPT